MQQRIKTIRELQREIDRLQQLEKEQAEGLRDTGRQLLEQMRPSMILKRAIADIEQEPALKKGVLRMLLANAAGFVGRKLLVKDSTNILKRTGGHLLDMALRDLVTRSLSPKNGQEA